MTQEFWDENRNLASQSSSGELWVPFDDNEYVHVFSKEGGLRNVSLKDLVDNAMTRPSFVATVLEGERARAWRAMHDYLDDLIVRAWRIMNLFKGAVEARLVDYVESTARNLRPDIRLYTASVIVIEVDDRRHLVHLEETGRLTWHDPSTRLTRAL